MSYPRIFRTIVVGPGIHSLDTSDLYGRGDNIADLSGENLQTIYNNIKRLEGTEEVPIGASREFYRMIESVKFLSFINFLEALTILVKNNWIWSEKFNSRLKQPPIIEANESPTARAFVNALGGKWGDTPLIKKTFLENPTGSKSSKISKRIKELMLIISPILLLLLLI